MNIPFLKVIFLFSIVHLFVLTALIADNKDSLSIENPEKLTIFNEIQGESLKSITIITAIDSILLNKKNNNSYPATLQYTSADGKTLERSVKIKPRGKSRRQYCAFPPLKIAFSGKELLTNGLRKQHRSLKLVTHCNDGFSANQNVLKEFLAVRRVKSL